MSSFVEQRRNMKVKLTNGGPIEALAERETRLRIEDGARLLVDLDDVVVFFYFPRFTGKGLEVRASTISVWSCLMISYNAMFHRETFCKSFLHLLQYAHLSLTAILEIEDRDTRKRPFTMACVRQGLSP
jgi:hypothetical protein